MVIKPRRIGWIIVGVVLMALGLVAALGVHWYRENLKPIDPTSDQTVRIDIKEGMTASAVAQLLEERQVIRSAAAMNVRLRLHGGSGGFQVGVYSVSPSQSVSDIIAHLSTGKPDAFSVTFYPGAMLQRADKNAQNARYDVYTALKTAGFDDREITRALAATYKSPVFAGRPEGAGLEGYVYGDTYFVQVGSTAERVIQVAIDEFARIVTEHNLERKFAVRGLTLYEGITLASIVERESIGCPGQSTCEDQRRIASVFYNRLKDNMALGSDVTYHYAADLSGQQRNFQLNSPYNTRIHAGLPPGPIAVPGLSALNAVADPAETDYLFFLSGDDNVTYFGKTEVEHNDNIRNHCHEKCQLP